MLLIRTRLARSRILEAAPRFMALRQSPDRTPMNVTVHERTPVDFELEIQASPEDLEPRLDKVLRAQRKTMNLKGFRPGKVPLQMVRKMHGTAIAAQVAEELIGEIWREEVAEDPARDVLGQPRITKLEFDYGQPLHAVLSFSVRPTFELEDTSDTTVRRLVRTVSDSDVDEEIERRLRRQADLVETETPAGDDSVVTVDIQEVDKESGTAVIGRRDEDQEIDLADERLVKQLKEALLGKKAGETFQIDLPHQHGPDEGTDHDDHTDRFMISVKTVKHRVLPDLSEEFIREQTADNLSTEEEYRQMVRGELETASRRLGDDFLREEIVRAMLDAHDLMVPEALVESVLDDMEQDLARRAGQESLPADFDREGFREARRDAAEHQARWILLQDKAAEAANLELTEEDLEAEFERLAENGPGTADMVRQFVKAQPQLLQNIQQKIMTERLFASLAERFTVVDVTPEELEAERSEEPA
jgi:trigger factor